MNTKMHLPKILKTLSKTLADQHAKAIIVGGSVRDHFLGKAIKDYDIEVYGLETLTQLETILSKYGSVNLVGRSFGVLKFTHEGEEYDFSFPREERKVDRGHQGFDVTTDGGLDYEMAARRRDFTINAIGYDVISGVFIDPFGGMADLEAGVLRHIDERTFVEDPLRVYRAVQFAARFGMEVAPETVNFCQQMVAEGMLDELPRERVWEEWRKLLLKSPKPSIGFELMRAWGITQRHFPELHALIGIPQSPQWHPEGDVWVHTLLSLDAMASILNREQGAGSKEQGGRQKLRFLLAILCHDLGKATHTTIELEDGVRYPWLEGGKELYTKTTNPQSPIPHSPSLRIRAIGHEEAGIEPARSLLYRLTQEHDLIESILPLVEHHLKPSQFYRNRARSKAIRKLATHVNIEELVLVARADFLGRTTEEARSGEYPAGEWLLAQSQKLGVKEKPLDNLLQGRDLIDLGLEPSPRFKEILAEVYEEQIQGNVQDKSEAITFVKRKYAL
jgi:tRNA nucleotidyltransferase (CCA-adding enzyme)